MTIESGPDRVPDPQIPRRRHGSAVLRVMGSLIALLVLAGIAGAGLGFYGYTLYSAPGPLEANKIYMVDKGLSTPEIAAKLAEQGIISNPHVFTAAAYLTAEKNHLKAGEYEFPAHASMHDVLAILALGKAIMYKLSIPEGWTSEMATQRINANDVLTGDPVAAPPEGSVLPDTYVFHRGKTRQQMLADMQAAQTRLVNELWPLHQADSQLRTPEEAVTLASIVEKETAKADERPVIASVFLNRLRKHMRLQSDPTIIYGIVAGKGRLDRKLTHADVVTPTPYNTYTIPGLPPGPIANPGRAALEAVINPQDTTYLYFVADGTGGHAFASTLAEHNKNVAKWRDIAGNAAAAEDAAAAGADTSATPDATTPPPGAGPGTAAQAPPSGPATPPAPPGNSGMPAIESTGGSDQPSAPAPAANEKAEPIPLPETAQDPAAAQTAASSPPPAAAPAAPAPAVVPAPAPAVTPAPVPAPQPPAAPEPAPAPAPAAATPAPAKPAEPAHQPPKPGSVIKTGASFIPVPRPRPAH